MKVGKLLAKATPETVCFLYDSNGLKDQNYVSSILDEERQLVIDRYSVRDGIIHITVKSAKDQKIKKIKKMIEKGLGNGCVIINECYVCIDEDLTSIGYSDQTFFVFTDDNMNTLFSINFDDIKKITVGEVTKQFD